MKNAVMTASPAKFTKKIKTTQVFKAVTFRVAIEMIVANRIKEAAT